MAKDEKDVKGIMQAIQNVLAEHDIDQARVVLELYEGQEQSATTPSSGTQREVEVVIADRLERHEAAIHGAHGATLHNTTPPAADAEVEDVTPLVVISDKEQPPQSPEKQPPLPRVQHNIAPEPPRPQSAVPVIQKLDTDSKAAQVPPLPPVPCQTVTPASTSGAAQSAEAALEATVPVLAQTARPPQAEAHDDGSVDASSGVSAIDQVMAGANLNPSALLPESLQRQLAQHEDRKRRTEILNSFVGKSVLLDNKKQREQASSGAPVAKHFLSSLTMNQGPSGVGSPAKEVGGSRHMTVRLPETEQLPKISPKKKKPAAAVGKVPVFSILNKESTLHEAGEGGGGGCGGAAHTAGSTTRGNSGTSRTSSTTSGKLSTVQLVDTVGAEAERRASDVASHGDKGRGVMQEHLDSILLTHAARPSLPDSLEQAACATKATQASTPTFPALVQHQATAQTASTRPAASPHSPHQYPSEASHGAGQECTRQNDKAVLPKPNLADGTTERGPRRTSLKQMLQEQEKMEQQSREGLAQHAKIMEKARLSILAMEAKNQQQLHLVRHGPQSPKKISDANVVKSITTTLNASPATAETVTTPATVSQQTANTDQASRHTVLAKIYEHQGQKCDPTTSSQNVKSKPSASTNVTNPIEVKTLHTPHEAVEARQSQTLLDAMQLDTSNTRRPETPPHRTNVPAPRTGIQVLNVTLPTEERARTEVIEQYSKSPAAAQHISTKDKYAALLTAQQKALDKQTEEEKEYKKLVEKAVEYNKQLGVKDV